HPDVCSGVVFTFSLRRPCRLNSAMITEPCRAHVITIIRGPRAQDLGSQWRKRNARLAPPRRGGKPHARIPLGTVMAGWTTSRAAGLHPRQALLLPGGRECKRRSNLQCSRRPSFSAAG